MTNILINVLGIQNSGGITVFNKLLDEISYCTNNYLIICNKNKNVNNLLNKFQNQKNFEFIQVPNKGILNRIYYENVVFRKIIKERNISLVYNFSGSAQFFLPIHQLTKVHNLLFYSKKLDKIYFQKKKYITWFKQVLLKRFVFKNMLQQTKYIEIQSTHVEKNIEDFMEISSKKFFIKSDITVRDELFKKIKKYDFSKKLRFLYIVGPHFEYLHKNFQDFIKIMNKLNENNFNFEIIITLSKEQLHNTTIWDKKLDKQTEFLGYIPRDELKNQFQDNTILISTSIVETLGLHVIESIQNGILTIVPNENYSKQVYGDEVLTYELFSEESLLKVMNKVVSLNNNEIKDIIIKNQRYLINSENQKYKDIVSIFEEIKKVENV